MVKIHIIGPVGSGKILLFKPTGDVRRSNEEIVNLIVITTKKNGWVSEGNIIKN